MHQSLPHNYNIKFQEISSYLYIFLYFIDKWKISNSLKYEEGKYMLKSSNVIEKYIFLLEQILQLCIHYFA